VPGAPREFVLADSAESEPDRVLASLGSRFTTAGGQRRTVRRVWLDTFDWRLHARGLVLEHDKSASRSWMELVGGDGERILGEPVTAGWPALVDSLPDGMLRERLGPITGVRALLPMVKAVSKLREVRVLNADEKTVVRIVVDRSSMTYPVSTPLPPRLLVVPVRGYEAEAARVERLLAATPGVAASPQPEFEAALEAAGRRPGDYSGKVDVHLTASMPAGAAVAAVLLHLLDTLEANVDGTVRDVDIEFLHDLRIAVRRTRSALKLAGDALPDGMAARFAPEFKWLGDLTTPTRDLDVYLLGFAGLAGAPDGGPDGGPDGAPEDLQPFRDYLHERREIEWRRMVRGLRSKRFAALRRDWRVALTGIGGKGRAARGEPTVSELAAARVSRAYRRMVRRGSAITPDTPAEALHDLRKRGKELRYLLEFFASLYDPAVHRRLVRELKALQDCLGEYQDCHVQRETIRAFATEMMAAGVAPAATVLAMGELTAALRIREQAARGEFADRFAQFTGAKNAGRIGALTTGAAA
jgi:CHAD domain-containing protein